MGRLTSDLPDRERLLTTIILRLRTTMVLASKARNDYSDERGGEYVHFKFSLDATNLVPGQLVLCETSGVHRFTIAVVVSPIDYSTCLIREFGSNRTCRMANEGFAVLAGMSESDLLEGDEYQTYRKIIKAFGKTKDYVYRFGGARFSKDGTVTVTIREVWGGRNGQSVPFDVTFAWHKRMSIKAIVAKLREGGLGTKAFGRLTEQSAT